MPFLPLYPAILDTCDGIDTRDNFLRQRKQMLQSDLMMPASAIGPSQFSTAYVDSSFGDISIHRRGDGPCEATRLAYLQCPMPPSHHLSLRYDSPLVPACTSNHTFPLQAQAVSCVANRQFDFELLLIQHRNCVVTIRTFISRDIYNLRLRSPPGTCPSVQIVRMSVGSIIDNDGANYHR